MSHDFFRIPGPAGEDHSWSTSQKQSAEPEVALFTNKLLREKTSQGQGTLSHKTETGVVHNVEVEIMQMTPGIYGEVCLLLKDRAGIFRACLTSKGVETWKNVKPGDHVLIKKASVITSKHHCPMRLICLDEESLSAIPHQPRDAVVEPVPQKPGVKIAHKIDQNLTNDLYVFTESDEEWGGSPPCLDQHPAPTESIPLENPLAPTVKTSTPNQVIDLKKDVPRGENDIEDLFDGMEDPF